MKQSIQKVKKLLAYFKPLKIRERLEYNRLRKLPPNTPTKTTLLGRPLSIIDSKLFLLGKQEIFDSKIYEFRATTPSPLVVDCGANIGLSIIFVKLLYPKAKIIAFEPDPNIFSHLEENIRNFNLSDVELHAEAVWVRDGAVNFYHQGGLSGRIPYPEDAHIISVPCVRLREFLAGSVDFLKIDIEGAETDVILDCADLLNNVNNLFVEYHSHISKPQTLERLLKIIRQAGFRYYIKDAFSVANPLINHETMLGMDMQSNIFCYRV